MQQPYVPKAYGPRRCIVCLTEFKPRRTDQMYCGGHRDRSCEQKLLLMQQNMQSLRVKALEAQDGNCAWCGGMGREKAYTLHVANPAAFPVLSLMFLKPWTAPYEGGYCAACQTCRRKQYAATASRLYTEPQFVGISPRDQTHDDAVESDAEEAVS